MTSESSSDILILTLPRHSKLNSFPNNLTRFWSDYDVKTFESCPAVLETPEQTHGTRVRMTGPRSYSSTTRKRTLSQGLGYQAHTKKGDCGSMLIATSGPHSGRYMGMHVAGGEGAGGFYGMSTIITREMLEEALNSNGGDVPSDIEFGVQSEEKFFGPNLRRIEKIPYEEKVHLSRKSKLKPSVLSEFLPWKPTKHLPILSPNDPRCEGEDPVVNMLNDTLSVTQPEVDDRVLDEVFSDMKMFYLHNLKWPIGKRMLTIEEAIGGIPGKLTSMKVNSSAGYPLVHHSKQRGKRDWFRFEENGELSINETFKEMVFQFLEQLKDPKTSLEDIEGRFLVYLKDELTTKKKIDEKRCRLIFGGDMIANVAFRMLFGSFIIAFQSSYRETPSAIGLNQYSYDMELIYQYLIEVGENFIAGDFKNFDKRMVKKFQLKSYELIKRLCDFLPPRIVDLFIHHETESPLQVFGYLLWLVSSHFSGCFFTTPENVLVHEMYLRYIFKKLCPGLIFEDHVRAKILGDDHIYSVSDEVKEFLNPITIAKALAEIGQTYTSDIKDAPLTEEHRPFTELTFLGAHPVDVGGKYLGALRKETLMESILWTRNDNNTILQECRTAMELMSAWGEQDYLWYYRNVNRALMDSGYDPIKLPSCETMVDIVANRTAAAEASFPWILTAQGIDPEFGLTKLNPRSEVHSTVLNVSNVKRDLSTKAMSETPMNLDFSTDSNVWRADFVWSSAQPAGTAIYTIDVPFGLLGLGDTDNIQNMPFERYTYWTGDVEVSLQINGQPFQQGLLAMYFMPLASYEAELANITTTNHVLLTPGESSTASLRVPYIYPRSMMNTYASSTESLGTIYVTPLSPLQSVAGETLNISVFSKFPDSEFKIPKINVSAVKNQRNMWSTPSGTHHYSRYNGDFLKSRTRREAIPEDVDLEEQGAGQSSSVNNTYYNVGGSMPIQDVTTGIGQSLDQKVEADLAVDASPMPLDNPPLCSGSIPVHQTFSGMSASHGVRPTNDMQLFPSALSREPFKIFNPEETKIDTLLGKKCLLTSFQVSSSDAIGKLLLSINLNTRMGMLDGLGIPFNVAFLNQFVFWRSHIRFEVVAVKTRFHSTRLNAVVTYGAPIATEQLRSVAFSHMIDFSGENGKFDFDVQWNAQTEFLRTYEGDGQVDPVQNYSLGNLSFFLTNALVAPESVEPSFQVLVFVRFVEPRVAVPRPFSPFTFNSYNQLIPSFTVLTLLNPPTPLAGDTIPGLQTNISVSLTNVGFNPTMPDPGQYNAAGTMLIVYRTSSGNLLTESTVEVSRVEIFDTTVSILFPGTLVLNTVASGSQSTVDFQSVTVMDVIPTAKIPEVEFKAQGNDVPPNQEDGTQPQDETVEAVPTTHEDTPTRIERPCKLEIGRKFEFVISDIHEIGRRYIRMKLVDNNDLDQFVVQSYVGANGVTNAYLNFSVQVQSYLRAFFAVWAGGVKYRIFNNDDNVGNVIFVPYLNTVGKICVPVVDALVGDSYTYDGHAYTSHSSVSAPMARERSYPISTTQFIDVSAPFQTHFNFCYNSKTQPIAPISSGTIAMSVGARLPEIYTSFADDLRLAVFRPPQHTRLDLAGYDHGVAGFFKPTASRLKRYFLDKPTPGVVLQVEPPRDVSGAQGK